MSKKRREKKSKKKKAPLSPAPVLDRSPPDTPPAIIPANISSEISALALPVSDSPALPLPEAEVVEDEVAESEAPAIGTVFPGEFVRTDEPVSSAPPTSELLLAKPKGIALSIYFLLSMTLFLLLSLLACKTELTASVLQSKVISRIARTLTVSIVDGEASIVRYPPHGPYDIRFGYSSIPNFIQSLKRRGFSIKQQAEITERHARLIDQGIFPIFPEKTQGGIEVFDRNDNRIYSYKQPEWKFNSFEEISSRIVQTLLFIEDRNLLTEREPRHNPAIEWDRFTKAILDLIMKKFYPEHDVHGGSTLATQLEKFRHSEGGRTSSPTDKLRQMASASLRAYKDGPFNLPARKHILLSYMNSVPLAALPGYGEVNGLGDGLWAYYGADPKEVNRVLSEDPHPDDQTALEAQAEAYRQIVSLFLAHRRPSDYLGDNPDPLRTQVERYLPLLYRGGIISYDVFKRALSEDVAFRRHLPAGPKISFRERKGPNLVRTHVLSILGLPGLYDLDRLDLQVHATLDNDVQEAVTAELIKLISKEAIKAAGLDGFRLLSTNADPAKLIYSFTLYERVGNANLLRVQTDNYDQPLNINEGVKLDLGSTAKFRTLATYLEIIEELFQKYTGQSKKNLEKEKTHAPDPLTRWALDYLGASPKATLREMLDAALERKYSANPGERFFTAGGVHYFENFNKEDNGKIVSVRHAIRHSINLPFIRLMRDIVRYCSYSTRGSTAKTLEGMEALTRREYLEKFADKEGKVFLGQFYKKYEGKNPEEILQILLEAVRGQAGRFAAIFWFLYPDAPFEEFVTFMHKHFSNDELSIERLNRYYRNYTTVAKSLGDKGYLARTHPLELYVAAFLVRKPNSSFQDIIDASPDERIEVYDWLFKTTRRHAQDKRIRMMLEAEAFADIHRRWQRVGYPMRSLVPSYATSLGTSADTPDGLAELMGIVSAGGKRLPSQKLRRVHFAHNTPYEVVLERTAVEGEQVLPPEVAVLLKEILFDIVENGTAIRLKGGIKGKEAAYPVGGKTGTGDHRFQVFGRGAVLKESRVVNRTATFMFIIGDRFFGTVTAFVQGPAAGQFKFTSALPVQLLKILQPELLPLLETTSAKNSKVEAKKKETFPKDVPLEVIPPTPN